MIKWPFWRFRSLGKLIVCIDFNTAKTKNDWTKYGFGGGSAWNATNGGGSSCNGVATQCEWIFSRFRHLWRGIWLLHPHSLRLLCAAAAKVRTFSRWQGATGSMAANVGRGGYCSDNSGVDNDFFDLGLPVHGLTSFVALQPACALQAPREGASSCYCPEHGSKCTASHCTSYVLLACFLLLLTTMTSQEQASKGMCAHCRRTFDTMLICCCVCCVCSQVRANFSIFWISILIPVVYVIIGSVVGFIMGITYGSILAGNQMAQTKTLFPCAHSSCICPFVNANACVCVCEWTCNTQTHTHTHNLFMAAGILLQVQTPAQPGDAIKPVITSETEIVIGFVVSIVLLGFSFAPSSIAVLFM